MIQKQHVIIQMPINEKTTEWAFRNYPHLIQTTYSDKRNQYLLLSRSLLQYCLKSFFDINHLPAIQYLEHGKPYFPDHPTISFNITHTDNTMAIIVANSSPVGIDIEIIKLRKNLQGLENRVLSQQEQNWLHQQSDYLQAFFTLWSAKEAYLKATGTGLSGLSGLELNLANNLALGPLIGGYLYLRQNPIQESFAYYLPYATEPNLYCFDGTKLQSIFGQWHTILCYNHHPEI